MIKKFWLILATGLGSGYSPIAPGTAGSAVAVSLYLLVIHFGAPFWVIPITIILFPLSIYAAGIGEKFYGKKDPGYVTVDEVLGYFVTVLFLQPGLTTAIIGFFVFRIFDIVKPYPGRKCENINGGLGIVLDDVVAGIYANILTRIIQYMFL